MKKLLIALGILFCITLFTCASVSVTKEANTTPFYQEKQLIGWKSDGPPQGISGKPRTLHYHSYVIK